MNIQDTVWRLDERFILKVFCQWKYMYMAEITEFFVELFYHCEFTLSQHVDLLFNFFRWDGMHAMPWATSSRIPAWRWARPLGHPMSSVLWQTSSETAKTSRWALLFSSPSHPTSNLVRFCILIFFFFYALISIQSNCSGALCFCCGTKLPHT